MHPTKRLAVIPLVAVIALLPGCFRKAAEEVDFGGIQNSVYTNNYFGLTLPIPAGWSVQDQEGQRELQQRGLDLVSGGDKKMARMLKASEMQSVNMLAVFKYPPGTPKNNPSLMAVAERVRFLPGIRRGRDYLEHSKKLLESGQLQAAFPKPFYPEKIAGRDFDVLEVDLTFGKQKVHQKYYSTILKGYALNFITSFDSPEDASELAGVLGQAKFSGTPAASASE